ncbi:MAG: glycosyltransferase family 9 protein [Alphaproteobacteria bacterium]
MKILLISATRIGDAVLSSVLYDAIKMEFDLKQDRDEIHLAVGDLVVDYFKPFPLIKAIYPIKKRRHHWHWAVLFKRVKHIRWDYIIDLRGSMLAPMLQLYQRRRIKTLRLGKYQTDTHQCDHLLGLFPAYKANHQVKNLPFFTDEQANRCILNMMAARQLDQDGFIVFGLGANWKGKIWPLSHFVELAQRLNRPNLPIILLGDHADNDLAQGFNDQLPQQKIINLCGKLNLNQALSLLSKSALFVGNDSGLMHIAAASGTRVIGLFGPSKIKRYHPFGEKCSGVCSAIPYDALMQQVTPNRDVQPSLMAALGVDAVLERVKEIHEPSIWG